MKNILLIIVCVIAVLGCDISKYVGSGNANNANSAKPASPESKPSPAASPKPEETPAKANFIPILKKAAGKYPYEMKLLDNVELQGRLKKLLGSDFAAMKTHWNVETPIEVQNGIFMATACEAHNCGANRYLLFVDLDEDNINMFHIEDDVEKHYFEVGEIKLPAKFAGELKN